MSRAYKSKKTTSPLFLISFIIFIICLGSIIYICFLEPYMNKSTWDEIKSLYYKTDDETNSRGNLEGLKSINEDIKGWIKIKDTVIDYPVLQSAKDDPEFYLYRNYKKAKSGFGSIFLDSLCNIENPSKNIIIYGHNMRDGSMFGNLLKYNDLDFYKSRPTIMFDTLFEKGDWKIISIFKTNTLKEQGEVFDFLKIDFSDSSDFLNYVYDVKVRSLINTPVDINKDDKLITLYTCSYELKEFRTIVVARKVREGESPKVDVEKASINVNPLMPSGYYKRHGGTPPKIEGFESDLKNGKIDWLVE